MEYRIEYSAMNSDFSPKFIYGLAIFIFLTAFTGCKQEQTSPVSQEKRRELANVLYNQQLYQQAVDEYSVYLKSYPLDSKESANISYMIANIYFDRLNDYENALAFYLRIKYLYPDSPLQNEVSKKMVYCLENLHRSVDAQQLVEQSAALDDSQKPKSEPGEIIAKIGARQITTGDLQNEINNLPVYMRDQLISKDKKIEFLKSFIAEELLFDSAKRKGLDKDREV
jgi:tetratricopeptide (TPR) repeat protein